MICCYLQGVSVVRYCQCSSLALQCPVRWDAFDGKSITQSQSDQYKVGPGLGSFIAVKQLYIL